MIKEHQIDLDLGNGDTRRARLMLLLSTAPNATATMPRYLIPVGQEMEGKPTTSGLQVTHMRPCYVIVEVEKVDYHVILARPHQE
jgi:hypothetical protein